MRLDTRDIPPPPDEPAGGQSCDGGHCSAPSVGWRYYPNPGEWLPVCGRDISVRGVPAQFRVLDAERWPESEAE